jgi:RimJ/RimL family protein N-acetyltransferase
VSETKHVRLRKAGADDVGFMMATERQPGFEWFVGQWDEAEHLEKLADPGNSIVIGLDSAGERCGFAIMRQNGDREQNLYLQRIAMAAPGTGLGRPMMRALIDFVFGETDTHRLWLLVKDGNDRALHVYHASGFTTEGKLRQNLVTPLGERGDAFMLSILRPEWSERLASATT